jgi:chitinase
MAHADALRKLGGLDHVSPRSEISAMTRLPLTGWVLALAACASAPHSAPNAPSSAPVIAGYVAGWSVQTKGTRIEDLPAARYLTHVIYAFGRVAEDGRAALGSTCLDAGICGDSASVAGRAGGNFAALAALKQRYPRLRVLVSIGGWTGSGRFSDIALTDASRRLFASSAIGEFIRRFPGVFDGIDIDWEYPVGGGLPENAKRPEDRRNFTLLMNELRRQLDVQGSRDGRRYELAAATTAGEHGIANLEVDSLAKVVDFLNVMTYDYYAGGQVAGFNAPLHSAVNDPSPKRNVDSTVAIYLRAGLPANKLVVGVPYYARTYANVPPANDGLFQTGSGAAPKEWTGANVDVSHLTRAKLEAAGFTVRTEPSAQAPYAYNPATGVWITFDDAESLTRKAAYVRARGLRGIMIWEAGSDDGTMTRAINDALTR